MVLAFRAIHILAPGPTQTGFLGFRLRPKLPEGPRSQSWGVPNLLLARPKVLLLAPQRPPPRRNPSWAAPLRTPERRSMVGSGPKGAPTRRESPLRKESWISARGKSPLRKESCISARGDPKRGVPAPMRGGWPPSWRAGSDLRVGGSGFVAAPSHTSPV